jgi:hypothetical protein
MIYYNYDEYEKDYNIYIDNSGIAYRGYF